jgi:hypothetical protein
VIRIFDELLKIDVEKCDEIFDEELKRPSYCKWHNLYSHATNNYNVFHQQIQSANNEGRFCLKQMQVDQSPFPIDTIDLQSAKVVVWPEQANSTKSKNVIIGKERPRAWMTMFGPGKWFLRRFGQEKWYFEDHNKSLSTHGATWQCEAKSELISAWDTEQTGQTDLVVLASIIILKSRYPDVDKWKMIKIKEQAKKVIFMPKFD